MLDVKVLCPHLYHLKVGQKKQRQEDRVVKVVDRQVVQGKLDAAKIVAVVCASYEISMDDLLRKTRIEKFAFPRQVVAYLLKTDLEMSFPAIGSVLKRDHTTVNVRLVPAGK